MNDMKYIGLLKDGKAVYDNNEFSNWKTAHKVVTDELLKEGLKKIDIIPEDEKISVKTVDFGKVIGLSYCVETSEFEQIFWAKRNGRKGETPTVINRKPEPSSKLSIVLEKRDENSYMLLTTYIGDAAPMEPWDLKLLSSGDSNLIEKSKKFWSTHALVYDRTVVEDFALEDGTRMSREEFEKKYIYNKDKNSNDIDVPEDSLFMIMGVSGISKAVKAKGFAERLNALGVNADIISSDEVRKEIFGNDIKSENKEIYTSDNKKIIYDTIVERAEKNLKEGTFTIVDATFLFETGENARRQLCKIAQDNGRPIRAVIMNTPIEEIKMQNQKRENPVDEMVIDKMYEYMNQKYDSIKNELSCMPNAKVRYTGANVKNKVASRITENSTDYIPE